MNEFLVLSAPIFFFFKSQRIEVLKKKKPNFTTEKELLPKDNKSLLGETISIYQYTEVIYRISKY